MKRIVVFDTDGTERVLDAVPSYVEMEKIVGGFVERVMVLDHVSNGRFIFTSMYVNEEGLLKRLPRNEKATAVYQRNVRAQYPNKPNPFRTHMERVRARLPEGMEHIDATPTWALAAGFDDDPWISGPAILFDGWTRDEVEAAVEREDES